MSGFDHCPNCGGRHLSEKTVEKILRGGNDTATVTVPATVCLDCGERLYSLEIVEKLDEIRARLEHGDLAGFQPIGQLFRVA